MTVKPTWIVEYFDQESGDIKTPREFLSTAIELVNPEVNNGWGDANLTYIARAYRNKSVNIIQAKDVDSNAVTLDNHYYVITIGLRYELFSPILSQFISKVAKELITKHNIPILLFYPYEYYEPRYLLIDSFIDELLFAHKINNEIIVLSLTSHYTRDGVKHSLPYSRNSRKHNISWALPTVFLNIHSNDTLLFMSCKLHDHKPKNKSKTFLCLNHLFRTNRGLLLQALHSKNLINNNIVSNIKPLIGHDFINRVLPLIQKETNYQDSEFSDMVKIPSHELIAMSSSNDNSSNACTPTALLKKIISDAVTGNIVQALYVDNIHLLGETPSNNYNMFWNKEWYTTTWCSVITETFFDNDNSNYGPVITEKSIKPITNFHPFVIFGHAHSHALLRELGFKTFEQSWFNLPPDGAPGNQTLFERLTHLINSLTWLESLSTEELTKKWIAILPDLQFNHDHLLKTNWYAEQIKLIEQRIK
jgi:hypothetical protein